MRVALDTNVLVSAFATRGICSDILHLVLAEHQLVLGETVVAELGRILHLKFGVPEEVAAETQAFLRSQATVMGPSPPAGVPLRDPDDELVLSEAVAGEADVLVTGDGDLLVAAQECPIRILSPRQFWEELRDAG